MTASSELWGHLLSIATFLLALAFVSRVLRSRRPPGSLLAWLLVIVAIPYLGMPLYLLLSDRKLRLRSKRGKERLYPAPPEPRASASAIARDGALEGEAARVRRTLLAAGGPPETSATGFALISTGEEAYSAMMRLIRDARESVLLTTFIFSDDSVGRAVLAELSRRAREGLQVRVLLDALGSAWLGHPSFRDLEQAGGRIAYFGPLLRWRFWTRADLRNHRKILVVDGREALIGGMNVAVEYMGPDPDPRRWVDLAVEVRGAIVSDLADVLASDWKYSTGEELPRPLASGGQNGVVAQAAASGPDVPEDALYNALLTAIHGANRRIWIATPYFVPDESLAKALELAARRGTDVRILVPARSNHALADLARGSYLRQAQDAGASILKFPRMLHAKAVVVDESLALVGSANFDVRSLLLNYEAGLFLYSRAEIAACSAWFEAQAAKASAGYPIAGFWRDLADGMGRVLGPLL